MSLFVLVAEQDRGLLSFIRSALTSEELHVLTASNGCDAIARAAAWTPPVAVVGTGFAAETVEIVRELRREFGLRILIAARGGDDAVVSSALEAGAVDFIELPTSRVALWDRVQEILTSRVEIKGHCVTAGPVTLDLGRHAVLRPTPSVALTPCEFEILRWFLTPPGRTFTRRQLLAAHRPAFGPRATMNQVDQQVASLKRKLGEIGGLIERAGEVGYRMKVREREGERPPLTNVSYEA